MEELSREIFIENSPINVEFPNIRTGEITSGDILWDLGDILRYFVSITDEILSDCQQIGTGVLLIINNYILSLISGSQCFLLFDSHSKDEIGRKSTAGTAVLLKFVLLQSLENYTKSVFYSNYPMTLYFQVQFFKLKCTDNAKSIIKMHWKLKERKRLSSLKKRYHQGQEKNARS